MPTNRNQVAQLTPDEFEEHVLKIIKTSGIGLEEFRTTKREKIQGTEGEYEIDVVARFSALNTKFLVLIECKHHKSPIKRDVIQVLKDRMGSIGAQKGMVFASVNFQSGALAYAKKHGIALVRVTDSEPEYFNRASPVRPTEIPTRKGAWLLKSTGEAKTQYTALGLGDPTTILNAMGLATQTSNPIEIVIEE
ncbi:restriction endonuclease [Pelagicoccus mobilis]|uniref:Restriction endonuclease n=1 Tax=Pelagicoccus mobilis TaxID=415221 RepID=A0A934VS94_9BACT|nr:restriction endonuclease [Pelagicoccus mobilis]MBK1880207.1 restriction endonuclease [Pelagicoccus mobilis]